MTTIAKHIRISRPNASNEDVDALKNAATALKTSWGKIKDVSEIYRKCADIAEALVADGNSNRGLAAEVEKLVQKKASAFVAADRPLEIGVVTGVAALDLLSMQPTNSGWLIIDVYAASLWSVLSFQPALVDAKREELRREVLEAARRRHLAGAEKARERVEVPAPGSLVAQAAGQITAEAYDTANKAAFDALARNAALDREELDFLWWTQLGRSRILDRPFVAIAEPGRIVAAGIEAAGHLRRLAAEVHRDVVLRTLEDDPLYDLAGLLAAIGEDVNRLRGAFAQDDVGKAPVVFPLLAAIRDGSSTDAGASITRPVSEWGARALLEASLNRMQRTGLRQL